jgi:GT2 family glycosyltransferase
MPSQFKYNDCRYQERIISAKALLIKGFTVLRADGAIALIKKIYSYYNNLSRNNYQKWIKSYGTYSAHEITVLGREFNEMERKPIFCLIIFLMESDIKDLLKTVDSIKKQIYKAWFLKIIIRCKLDTKQLDAIKNICQDDVRIFFELAEYDINLIDEVKASVVVKNADWVGIVESGDLISLDALFLMTQEIVKNSAIELVYCDSDLLDKNGRRHSPHFNCDWNPDLFYSQALDIKLTLYKSNLILRLRKNEQFKSCELKNFYLTLCSLEQMDQNNICHFSRVLYHENPDRLSVMEGCRLSSTTVNIMKAHFSRLNIPIHIAAEKDVLRLTYSFPNINPHVSILIPTKDRLDLLDRCVKSLVEKTAYKNYNITIIDNGSVELVTKKFFLDVQRDNPNIKVIECPGDFNFSKLVNLGFKHSCGEVLCLLNNDIEIISKDWLDEMVGHALRPGIGAVGAKLLYPNGFIQHGGVILGLGPSGIAGHFHHGLDGQKSGYLKRAIATQEISAVTAACMVIKRDYYELVGGFDEENLPVDFNDVDFCLKLRRIGLRNIWTPYAVLYHHEHGTRKKYDYKERLIRLKKDVDYMKKKWGSLLNEDPFYSPNLSLDRANFVLAFPPRS